MWNLRGYRVKTSRARGMSADDPLDVSRGTFICNKYRISNKSLSNFVKKVLRFIYLQYLLKIYLDLQIIKTDKKIAIILQFQKMFLECKNNELIAKLEK